MIIIIAWWLLGILLYLSNIVIVFSMGEHLFHAGQPLINTREPKERRILFLIAWTWPLAYVLLILFFWSSTLANIFEQMHKRLKERK